MIGAVCITTTTAPVPDPTLRDWIVAYLKAKPDADVVELVGFMEWLHERTTGQPVEPMSSLDDLKREAGIA